MKLYSPRALSKTHVHDQLLKTDDRRPNYSIVIPAYNEGARLGATLEKVLAYVAERNWDAEVIAVNDGSRDNTAEIIRGYAERNPRLRCWRIQATGARDTAYETGCCTRRAKYCCSAMPIFPRPSRKPTKLFAAIADGADVAIGSRWLRSDLQTQRQPLYRQLFGRIFNLLLRITLGLNFKDTQCGFKAFTRRAADTIFPLQNIERWGFDPELLYLAKKFKLKVVEVPVAWAHSEGTRISPLRDGTKMFLEMLKIRWNALSGKYGRGTS